MYVVNFTNQSLDYTNSFLTKEYEGDEYRVIYLHSELLKEACIAGGTRWPNPFNEWSKIEILGILNKPDFFIRSFNPYDNTQDAISWMPSVFSAESVKLKRTYKECFCNKEPQEQLRVIFKNGRHRAEFFRYLGAEYIPVLTTKNLIKTLSVIGNGTVTH